MANIHHFFFDVIDTSDGPFGFVEARTRVHKTSTTAERKAMYMPYVASVNGIGSGSWSLKWKAVLEELGLLDLGAPHGPICRAPTVDGGFTKRPVSTSEGTNMINAYLGYKDGDKAATTTHFPEEHPFGLGSTIRLERASTRSAGASFSERE